MSLNDTPKANRLHIAFFGKRNAGKSSLINAFVGQDVSIVSDDAGTTTDPVYKAMEIYGLGPCTIIDTAGFDDEGSLGELRVKKTKEVVSKTDIAVLIFNADDITEELRWFSFLKEKNIPTVVVLNKVDLFDASPLLKTIEEKTFITPLCVSAKTKAGLAELKSAIINAKPKDTDEITILGDLVQSGDTVVLVMPQNIQAPKGRLILPQVQTIRELLDRHCIVVAAQTENLESTLAKLNAAPTLIITDSQDFDKVAPLVPSATKLTSFSVLFARYKGDLITYLEGTKAFSSLNEHSSILIAECCSHAPLSEDIGREKIPNLLRKSISPNIKVSIVSGSDYPEDLTPYDLIIQCGGCMLNRREILSRIERATNQNVPITNYGLALAYLKGIPLEKLTFPKE